MIPARAIQIWEQHAGGRPTLHAWTENLDAVAGVIRAWASQFCRRPVVAQHSGDDVLIVDVSDIDPRPIALLWVEYPDDLRAEDLPPWLHARWDAPTGGETWDTRDGARRRVGR